MSKFAIFLYRYDQVGDEGEDMAKHGAGKPVSCNIVP
jgi:hypothetical protein